MQPPMRNHNSHLKEEFMNGPGIPNPTNPNNNPPPLWKFPGPCRTSLSPHVILLHPRTWDKKKIKDKGTIYEGIMRGTGEFYVNMTLARVVLEERTAIEKMPLPDWPVAGPWHISY